MTYLSLPELCKELSISTATGRNWLRLQKLIPQHFEKGKPLFTTEYAAHLKSTIASGHKEMLKSRRNKKYISGHTLYHSYVSKDCKTLPLIQEMLTLTAKQQVSLSLEAIQYLAADCALHLFARSRKLPWQEQKHLLARYLTGDIMLPKYDVLVDALVENKEAALAFCKKHPELFCFDYPYEAGEDTLGLLYLSCKNIGSRKASGSYYTPTDIVRKLIANLDIEPPRNAASDLSAKSPRLLLDPCCGTGNFLLQLPETVPFENIYGNDLDSVSVAITRLNMALKFPDESVETICRHITQKNYLTEYETARFHYIIGNPPWGYNFSEDEKEELRKRFKTASGKTMESYDLFIEQSLANLMPGGQLSFVLPEAILNVKGHTAIRSLLLKSASIRHLEFLGNVFDGVQCPCIILRLEYTRKPLSTIGMTVHDNHRTFCICTERNVSAEHFCFSTTDEEHALLLKLKHTKPAATLAKNADFALGIVTGNNKDAISAKKSKWNEPVLKGTNILKYHYTCGNNYIRFQPETFQQAAPLHLYRAPEKLLYRFICDQPVFAYDNRQMLSLNSCNLVIPHLPGIDIKYILAILNSGVTQFIFKKEFRSIKVLRSHLESIPIPLVDNATQKNIIALVDLLIAGQPPEETLRLYNELEHMIFDIFNLNETEKQLIQAAIESRQKFLY